ncbi:putative F-box/FBD/LRR-repeat protein At1g78760 [Trifolium pratense]|uniref:putative F-box/FBD/LRR-repeat protein At1g78760 n=1 Tax=Trifolium pratense TaxID=57577 RepID=UPI001E696DBE|nr:putative F-box/FBD/LRR-repeat protein At1g78760 [Trifolium pratense]XP_045822819.1 putative F-box/FBD/LRR-repeat protein At1g78760 [Trifolium pratense]
MKPKRQKYNDHDVIEDRLSNIPDFVLLHILSFVEDTKRAVQTCILSKRWKNIWKHLHSLTLNSSRFSNYKNFTKFVSRILSLRQASTSLHSLDFQHHGIMESRLLKRIVKYAVSHNVQRLRIHINCHFHHFPTGVFSCHTLTSLDLYVGHPTTDEQLLFPNSLDLPALTSLSLNSFTFCVGDDGRVDPFSTLSSLNSLIIRRCKVRDANAHNLCISSATLVNLTIETGPYDYCKVELSTPILCTFDFVCTGGVPALCGSNNNLSSVKHVNINVKSFANCTEVSLALLSWLVELANIKSLIITSSTLKVLSWLPELLEFEFRSLCNLKLLKLKTDMYTPLPLSIPNGTLYFLLQNSPSAKVEITC